MKVLNSKIILLIFVVSFLLILLIFFSLFKSKDSKIFVEELLKQVDININGNRPWDVKIHNENLYDRVMQEGSLGLGEAYMEGWWDCASLDQFFFKILNSELNRKVEFNWNVFFSIFKSKLINLQSKNRANKVGEQHYDLDNELFENMLDKNMIYSCGYWKNAKDLDEAQERKLDLICRKLNLKSGMTVLDIGCGWGGFAYYAAKNYGVKVTGITISKEQVIFAKQFCKNLPIEIVLQDYRDINKTYDRIVSIGMFEHVGYKNYKDFMKIVSSCLKDDGLFLLHTIGGNTSVTSGDPWITKYIFPNSMLPSIRQISDAIEGLFVMEDWHNFSSHYDKTLMAWFDRFNTNWEKIKSKYDQTFYRMWKYYLLSCAALFRARKAQLWQIVLSKKGVLGGYNSIR